MRAREGATNQKLGQKCFKKGKIAKKYKNLITLSNIRLNNVGWKRKS